MNRPLLLDDEINFSICPEISQFLAGPISSLTRAQKASKNEALWMAWAGAWLCTRIYGIRIRDPNTAEEEKIRQCLNGLSRKLPLWFGGDESPIRIKKWPKEVPEFNVDDGPIRKPCLFLVITEERNFRALSRDPRVFPIKSTAWKKGLQEALESIRTILFMAGQKGSRGKLVFV